MNTETRRDILEENEVKIGQLINLAASERVLRAWMGEIAHLAIDGDPRFRWEAIGDEDDASSCIDVEGATLRLPAATTDDVAVWEHQDGRVILVGDANGPVMIHAGLSSTAPALVAGLWYDVEAIRGQFAALPAGYIADAYFRAGYYKGADQHGVGIELI